MSKFRAICIYLPQFHPIPENDKWWGKGFTEWRNVVSAKPLTKNHYQPHLPSDLGFYDLRLSEVFYEQINLAKEAGIYGFMFYEYWFSGKRLLETPIENYLKDSSIDFPYFLCWANENWTRNWDGWNKEVLLKQEYSIEDFSNHFDQVYSRHFLSDKYIKVYGKPVISIYKPELIPQLDQLKEVWVEKAKALGFPGIYFICCESSGKPNNPENYKFDASYEFQPNWDISNFYRFKTNIFDFLVEKISNEYLKKIILKNFKYLFAKNYFYDYRKYSEDPRHNKYPGYKRFPCIMPSWDNSPRRKLGNAAIFLNSSPKLYFEWFNRLSRNYRPYSEEENFIFINAWNEWAEGAHLEPCQKWGKANLIATKKALLG
jgi:hypothetical protein